VVVDDEVSSLIRSLLIRIVNSRLELDTMNLIGLLKSTVSVRSVASLELIRLLLLSNDIVALSCFRPKKIEVG